MDKEDFTSKILAYEQTMYRVSMSMLKNEADCQDAVQDTILTAYSKINTLKNEDFFKTWVIRILINKCNKILNNRKRNPYSEDTYIEVSGEKEENIQRKTELRIALESLRPKIRIVMVMFYVEDFSIDEIHKVLKIPVGTVKSRLSQGRKQMKFELIC